MNKHIALELAAFAALTAFAAPRAVEEITFRPAAGARMVYTSDWTLDLELAEGTATQTQDGQEQELDSEGVEITLSQAEKIVFTDEILEAGEGVVAKLRRTFDEVAKTLGQDVTAPGGEQSNDTDGTSELEGKTVVFTWDAEQEAHTAAFEGEEGDTDLLEELECSVDFAEFLPAGDVSVEDTWTVDAKVFNKVLSPSGELHIVMEGDDPDKEDTIPDQLEDNIEGEITCTFAELREEGEARLAVIAITAKLASKGSEESSVEHEVGTIAIEREVSIGFDLEGELLWNLTERRAAQISFGGDVRFTMNQDQALEAVSWSMSSEQVFEGTLTQSLRIE